MKRSQSSPILAASPKHKKTKISVDVSPNVATDLDADGGEWTKVEKRKLKKVKKTEVKIENQIPRFMYSNAELVKRSHAVSIDDIRELILHLVADAPPPNWLRVENARSIQKVVTLLIPGLTPALLSLPPLPTSATANPNLPLSIPLPSTLDSTPLMPFIASTFSHTCPTRAPGEQTRMHSVLSSFFHGPVSSDMRKKIKEQRLTSERALDKDPTSYVLTLEQMIENDYPIPSYMADVFEKPLGWIETPEQPKPSLLSLVQDSDEKPHQRIYAIDCEMCLTEDGKELTRISIIDYHSGIVVYDQLVKPSKPILDYLTRWSGITAQALAHVTTTLEEVQAHLIRLLSPPAPIANPFSLAPPSERLPPAPSPTPILLGHSLESDLKALKLCHPLCIDTAIMYHHPRGRPLKPGLAWLTKKWCGREIQTGGEGGHNPEEDARACLDLLKKKLQNGPGFGEFKTDYESIFERMSRSMKRSGEKGNIRLAVVDHGNPSVMHGAKANTSLGCNSDDEVLQGLLGAIPTHQFAFGRFMGLADALGWTTPKAAPDPTTPIVPLPIPDPPSPEELAPACTALNTHLATLHASLPPRTAFIILTGHSDPRRMAALNTRKSAFETAFKSGKPVDEISKEVRWTTVDGRELEEEVEKARRGLLFIAVKQ